MGFRYLLVTTNGAPAGTFAAAVPDWKVGDEFFTGDGRSLRIVAIDPELDGAAEFAATWTVEPAGTE